ncbi:MAG: hypothetical protein ACRDRJ_37045 [Streptosporangiaceae bacterium]
MRPSLWPGTPDSAAACSHSFSWLEWPAGTGLRAERSARSAARVMLRRIPPNTTPWNAAMDRQYAGTGGDKAAQLEDAPHPVVLAPC